jgi:membrane protease YdiL (CAAX protease family)
MMLRLWSVIKRHPIITFFVLTYALSWILESPLVFLRDSVTDTQGLVLILLASNVPSVLAIVLTAVVLGRGSLRKLLARLVIWRVNPLWYLVVVVPAVLAGGMVAFNALLGGPAISVDATLLSAAILLAFMIVPGSALGEEIGWRGYALPRLQTRMSALSASFLLAPIWALWHLPLWLTGAPGRTPLIYAAFVVSAFGLSVLLTWVYNSTGGSLLLVVLLHATINLPIRLLYDSLGSRVTVPVLLYFGLTVVAAVVVIIVYGPQHLSRKHRKQEEVADSRMATPGIVQPTPT